MREISDILGISPDCVHKELPESYKGVDESALVLDQKELETMAEVAQTAIHALIQLRTNSSMFENELRELSQEMSALESRSSSLHHRLHTREHALKLLEPLLEDYVVPSDVIQTIFEGEMDAKWYNALEYVRKPQNSDNKDTKCSQGASRLRKVLISRALERAKVFYIARLRMLRRPGINAQRIQMDFIQSKDSIDLLRHHTPRLASALGQAYRNTIKWYYSMLFGKYGRWLNRLPLMITDSPKLLGLAAGQSSDGSLLSMGASVKSIDAFSVGARPSILKADEDALPALPMTAVSSGPPYPIEILTRSLLVTLADSFAIECKVGDLFSTNTSITGSKDTYIPASVSSNSVVDTVDSNVDFTTTFVDVFKPVLTFYSELISEWIANCKGDLFGLLVVVKLLDSSPLQEWIKPWLKSLTKKCWANILNICEQQAQSIEQAALKASTVTSGKHATLGPHVLTQLTSSYLSGILQLCSSIEEPELAKSLKHIVEAYELFISKLANGNEKVLYNNYFVMSALLSDIEGPLAQDFASHFQLLVNVFSSAAN